MVERITCPAPLDMLRKGSPVIRRGEPAVVLQVNTQIESALVVPDETSKFRVARYLPGKPSPLEMDLTDATGRAHAAWWVAERECSAPGFLPEVARFIAYGDDGWRLDLGSDRQAVHYDAPSLGIDCSPEFGPTKPFGLSGFFYHRLPDGSRRVDALALKAVVEHLMTQDSDHG